MEKEQLSDYPAKTGWQKFVRIMKLTTFLIFVLTVNVSASLYSQNSKISVKIENGSLNEIFSLIEEQSEYRFFYQNEQIRDIGKKTVEATDRNIQDLVADLLDNTGLSFRLVDRNIIIFPRNDQSSAAVTQQPRQISGQVTDQSGSPLPGVTVVLKGTTRGTITDSEGNYAIPNVAPDAVLVFSFVGMKPQEIPVSGKPAIYVTMAEEAIGVNEVVVVGYGTQAKKDIIGSVSVIDVDQIKSIPVTSGEQALQGQAAGVNVITSGVPGAESKVFIRGISSFGNTQPLVIVDGIQGSLADVNPNDIESVQVLKDAGAASIYGVRGSNGVIVVTTKKGKTGAPVFTYDGYFGMQAPPSGNVFNTMNTSEYAGMAMDLHPGTLFANGIPDYLYGGYRNGVFVNGTAKEGDPAVDPALYKFDPNDPYADYLIQKVNKEGTDWFHEIFKDAPMHSHSFSASMGTEKANYAFSMNYQDQQGTLIESRLKRYSIRLNSGFNIGEHVRIGENLNVIYKENPNVSNQDQNSAIAMTYRSMPLIPVYDIMGNFGGTFAGPPDLGFSNNPVAVMKNTNRNKSEHTNINGSIFMEIDFLKYFTARTRFGGAIGNSYYLNFSYNAYYDREAHYGDNSLREENSRYKSWTWTNTLEFENQFGKHHVKLLGGSEAISGQGRTLGGSAAGFLLTTPEYLTLSNGTKNIVNWSHGDKDNLYSLFARLDYAFNDQYLFGATVRRDGSSRFGADNRYGVFPSFSAGWRISKAAFLSQVEWIDDLKLRGSWGKLGSQNNVGLYNAYTLFNSAFSRSYYDINGDHNIVQGFYASSIGNTKTGWEEDIITNAGFDLSVLNSKFTLSAEWYKKSINGLLFPRPLPSTAGGASAPTVNIGDIQNTGVDFTANYRSGDFGKFRFDVGLNLTTYKNEVIDIPNPGYFYSGGTSIGAAVRNEEGHPISAFYGYQVEGLFRDAADVSDHAAQNGAAPGRFKYKDVVKDDKIDDADRTFIGDPNPDFTYGINLNASYDNFDLSVIFYGSQGNDIFNYTKYFTDFWDSPAGNKGRSLLNAWSEQNPGAKVPVAEAASSFSTSGVVNSYYVENGSFLKCKNLTVGYRFKPALLNRIGLDKMRLYVQVANLFTLTKYSGLDPELTPNQSGDQASAAFGIDYANYPTNQKSYLIGLNITF
ncbi:MAG: TonB-dependent receptor [Prolixibacteraceae bacterium]